MAPTSEPAVSFALLDARVRAAVEAAIAEDPNPADPLRGLYISDEQALSLAAEGATPADAQLAEAAARLRLDALDTAVLGLCAAPELDPRYGRLFAYLHDDVTRRLVSPRLCAELLTGDGVAPADVLGCFGPAGRLHRTGALRLVAGDGTGTLADRAVKVADRLAAFLLGAGGAFGQPEAGGTSLRRHDAPAAGEDRRPAMEEVRTLLAAGTRLPVVVCGPDAGAVLAAATGHDLLLADVRDLHRQVAADALLAAALEGRTLAWDGLGGLEPGERQQVLRALDEFPERVLLLAGSRREALAARTARSCSSTSPCRRSASARRPGRATPAATTCATWRRSSACPSRRSARRPRSRGSSARSRLRRPPRLVVTAGRARRPPAARPPLGRPRPARPPARAAARDLRLPAPPRPGAVGLGL